ncbi:sensor histidine kinase [Oceanibacterium hippocampi]|uniref:sensor histidine kinase n=1 Tax=Oceanibacterium hippocampi TaxID=745714 RepID=UPI00111C0CC7|nr:HAMP domain-containing sensor histidine kinase [Oceanibacterium hippocampi]
MLLAIFLSVPILLYQQFRVADGEKQALLLRSAHEQGRLVTRALTPTLTREDAKPFIGLAEALKPLVPEGASIKVLFRPIDSPRAAAFYYVAAEPPVPDTLLEEEFGRLINQGLLDSLASTCADNIPLSLRYRTASGNEELLTSINSINSNQGCWAVVTTHRAADYLQSSLGRPYWQTPEVSFAMIIYMAMALITFAMFLSLWRTFSRFGQLARDLRTSGSKTKRTFSEHAETPELVGVARDIDRLVETLRGSADAIRQAAEENAHAYKGPIAVIRQAVEQARKAVPQEQVRGRWAVNEIDRQLDRLDGIVAYAWRMDEATADLIDPPRENVDLSTLLNRMLSGYASLLESRRVMLQPEVDEGVVVQASEELLETVIENLLENAISFSPAGGSLKVALRKNGDSVALAVEDDGPGVSAGELEKIFDRYYTKRPKQDPEVPDSNAGEGANKHIGIGLWIVRRKVEAVGGKVRAELQEAKHGLRMSVTLPLAS